MPDFFNIASSQGQSVPISPLFVSALRENTTSLPSPVISTTPATATNGLNGIFTQATPGAGFAQIEAFVDQNVQPDGKPLPTLYRDHETFALYLAKYQILDDDKIDPFELKVLAQSDPIYVRAVDYILSQKKEPVLLETPFGSYRLGANSLSPVPQEASADKKPDTTAETATEKPDPEKTKTEGGHH